MSFHIKRLASILLLCQISIMTSHPVVNEGEQKQDIFYRNNANIGVIIEEPDALHRDEGSSDTRNRTILLSQHARAARSDHDCVMNSTKKVFLCGKNLKAIVRCREASHGCLHRLGSCSQILSVCSINGELKKVVTGCKCS